MAQKSLFGKFMNLFSKPSKKSGGSTLSASQAIHMQNAYIEASCSIDMQPLPPYPEIVKQLYSPKEEVFSAALYYLHKIANNEPTQTQGITEELNKCLSAKNKIPPQHKEQIAQILADIGKFHKIR